MVYTVFIMLLACLTKSFFIHCNPLISICCKGRNHQHQQNLRESATTYTYTGLPEFSIPGNCFAISDDPAVRGKIHKSLQKLAGAIISEYNETPKSREKQASKTKSKKFLIFEGQAISVAEFKREIDLTKKMNLKNGNKNTTIWIWSLKECTEKCR